MESTIDIALSRQIALRTELEITAHNIANMTTPAYKAEHLVFQEYLVEQPGYLQAGEPMSFTQDVGLARDLSDGSKLATGNPFDLAISGEGFFTVETPDGDRYTRHGRFELNNAREMVNSEGHPLMSFNGGRIIVPADAGNVVIAGDGTVSTAAQGIIGRIGVFTFDDPLDMKRLPNSLYETTQAPQLVDQPTMKQGMLEQSNVQPIVELTRLIEIQREHQAVQNVINQEHERQQKAITTIADPTPV